MYRFTVSVVPSLLLWSSILGAVVAEVRHRATNDSIIYGSSGHITLNSATSTSNIVILDYGFDVEGHPVFEVLSATGDTSRLEITYSETKTALDNYMSDGPLALAAAIDTYRVNSYNITGPSSHVNRLIQGGFRYQKLNLSTAGELVLSGVGVKPTTSTTPLSKLPGSFECSDTDLTRIWNVGARTIQLNEIPANSIPSFWQVSSEGSLVESQAPQVLFSATALALIQYEVTFDVKPIVGGFGFSVLASSLNSGIYIFVNVANGSISAHFGATERDSAPIALAVLPPSVVLGQWNTVSASVAIANISVSINSSVVLHFSQFDSFYGSFGLGASYLQSAIYRNLSATTLAGEAIYTSSLTDPSFFPTFLLGTNPADAMVDGSKRDRIAYAGDLDVASASSLASTYGITFIQGTVDLLGSFELAPGFFVPQAKIQQAPLATPIDANITGLIGYSFSLLTAAAHFYQSTGNVTFAETWAPRAVRMVEWANSQVLPDSGLLNISDASFGGDWDYYDPGQSGVVSKFNVQYAYALQETIPLFQDAGVDITEYTARLDKLRTAIDTHLWSDTLNAYILSDAVPDGFAQDTNALAILAGITNDNHSSSTILATLNQLSTPAGPLSFSNSTITSGFSKFISPYASTYHLRAALASNDTASALDLLKTLWAPMANPAGTNYTGCFWETLNAVGAPALGLTTSLCHAWAAGPTAELSRYVLGVKAVKPGYKEWSVEPLTLGLDWAAGKMPVPGGVIGVKWNVSNGLMSSLEVRSPQGTRGTVTLPTLEQREGMMAMVRVNGEIPCNSTSRTFEVQGGATCVFSQEWISG